MVVLSGIVRDAVTRAPIPGALVSLDARFTAITAPNGSFSLDVPPGRYVMSVVMRDYHPARKSVDLFQNTFAEVDLQPAR